MDSRRLRSATVRHVSRRDTTQPSRGFWWHVKDWTKLILFILAGLIILSWASGGFAADDKPAPNCDYQPTACEPFERNWP